MVNKTHIKNHIKKTQKYTKKNTKYNYNYNKIKSVHSRKKEINELEELQFFNSLYKSNEYFPSCLIEEYRNLQNSKFNYKQLYKDYDSDQQINAIVKISIKYDPNFFLRLLGIAAKRFNPEVFPEVYKILMSKKPDSIIYKDLHKLYNSVKNMYKNPRMSYACNTTTIIAQTFFSKLVMKIGLTEIKKIQTYLDIGAGDCKFAKQMGITFNILPTNVYGVDLNSFSEKGDWGRSSNMNGVNFYGINNNEAYPFEDNMFDLVSMKMVLHHIENIDFYMSEFVRILKNGGYLCLFDHDAFTYADYMLCDIEHGYFMNVFNNKNSNETLENKNKNKKENQLGFVKYRNWLQIDYLFHKYGFKFVNAGEYSSHINKEVTPTRAFIVIYKLNKN